MATATADHETKTETVTFASISPNQLLTRRPRRKISDGMGGYLQQSEEEYLEQERARNRERVDRGDDPLPIDETPWAVEFVNHQFSTDNAKLIDWLRSHKNFRTTQTGGFYEIEPAPEDLRPTVLEQVEAIARLAADGSQDGVEAVKQAEEETHSRPVVLKTADAALERMSGVSPEPGDSAETTGNGDSPESHRADNSAQ